MNLVIDSVVLLSSPLQSIQARSLIAWTDSTVYRSHTHLASGFHVAQTSPESFSQLKMCLHSSSSCLYSQNAGITSMNHTVLAFQLHSFTDMILTSCASPPPNLAVQTPSSSTLICPRPLHNAMADIRLDFRPYNGVMIYQIPPGAFGKGCFTYAGPWRFTSSDSFTALDISTVCVSISPQDEEYAIFRAVQRQVKLVGKKD